MKELKDYLPLYIGCKIVADRIYHLVGVTKSEVQPNKWIAICDPNPEDLADSFLELYAEEVKLILRPLESMTKEERIEMDRVATGVWRKTYHGTAVGNESVRLHLAAIIRNAFETDFLLKKGFDIFGLKEAGLAVYE